MYFKELVHEIVEAGEPEILFIIYFIIHLYSILYKLYFVQLKKIFLGIYVCWYMKV